MAEVSLTATVYQLTLEAEGQELKLGFTTTGEINTASNVNTGGGVGVFDSKTGTNLGFRGVKAGDGIGVAYDSINKEILVSAEGAGAGLQTPITVNIDYNGANVGDPTGPGVFTSQAEVDAFLADRSPPWTGFKHVNEFLAHLPQIINKPVTMNVAAGVQRPSASSAFNAAFDLGQNLVIPGGNVSLVGQPPSAWTTVAGPLTIQSHLVASFDPSLTFSGTPFAGQNYRGYFVRLSTNQTAVIHDHDNSTLKITASLWPTPVDGVDTATIVRPSTILRNSTNDIFEKYSEAVRLGNNMINSDGWQFIGLQDVQVDGVRSIWGIHAVDWHGILNRVMIDHEYQRVQLGQTPNGRDFQLDTVAGLGASLLDCSLTADAANMGSRDEPITSFGALYGIFTSGCYVANSPKYCGAFFRGALALQHTVLDNVGTGSAQPSLYIEDLGTVDLIAGFTAAIPNTIRNKTGSAPAVWVNSNSTNVRPDITEAVFANITGPCVKIQGRSWIDISQSSFGFRDGGGNSNYGIEFEGQNSNMHLNPACDITGASGDILMADGDEITYSELGTFDVFIDGWNNSVRQ